ncbi:hypothetical protein K503DRAFT_339368 [Rhizopogon vinicolor AM-OR11-026]|uniref:F-box domain-containing protein n=1 Tax=Rhizopogon vinicolor AM-OR11-026 TaxID=1314800 RepID=A0A1B7MTG2_9AGAM|nr:hypothetical protein K503DRAFT_339368 [Rhizopogon vinicolor AM-OR11-026]
MHRALFVLEVLREIFLHIPLHCWRSRSDSRKSLAALARTCRTFYDPAMDLLWADMDKLEPLLGCVTRLHPLIYDSDEYFRIHWSRGVEPLSEYEARQFLRHAARVRSLWFGYTIHHIHLLSVFPIETCVFPRLQSLTWHVIPTTKHLHLFLSPMLRRCNVNMSSDLKSIATRCANLESLSIGPYSCDTVMERDLPVLCETVRSCNRIIKLSCPLLDSAVWKHFSSLPTLVTLTISGEGPNGLLDRDNLDFAPFLNLAALSFRFPPSRFFPAANILTVMQHSKFPSLKEFELRDSGSGSPWSEEQAEQFFRALSQFKAQTLENIAISFHSKHQDNPLIAISHFLCFTQLRRLQLSVHGSVYLDNDLFKLCRVGRTLNLWN